MSGNDENAASQLAGRSRPSNRAPVEWDLLASAFLSSELRTGELRIEHSFWLPATGLLTTEHCIRRIRRTLDGRSPALGPARPGGGRSASGSGRGVPGARGRPWMESQPYRLRSYRPR